MQIGLMLEGQYGLTWTRWQHILEAAERLGYAFVFRSDHFTEASGPHHESLECWVSLTYAASQTQRIEFGSMVSPITFRHPALLARMAAAVDDLSGGRLILGLGAGWQEREHHNFGIPFYDFPTRYAMFEEGLEVTVRLLRSDDPVHYQGKYFSLDDAVLLPRPQRKTPILIGGNGPTRTLPLAARYADEWNGVFISPETFKERNELLNKLCEAVARDPKAIQRSLMTKVSFFPDAAQQAQYLAEANTTIEALRGDGRMIAGTPEQVIEQIRAYEMSGCERIMLQWLDLDDLDGIEAMAQTVLPAFHGT
ncbi:MAG: TIGR03560 family F420-dependent LLM class oxidoreductase [bacterium]|nr:TIGR03560 family F420-dependent LLM class oxidoreductase [bacterium]